MSRSSKTKPIASDLRVQTSPRRSAAPRRVVVVGDRAVAQRVQRLLGPEDRVVRVGGFLSAMGEADRQSITAVVGPVSALSGMAASTAESLRHLAPRARLVVIEDPRHAAEVRTVLEAGFDHALPLDMADAQLAEALNLPQPTHAKTQTSELRELDAADFSTLELNPTPAAAEPPTTYDATLDAAMPTEIGRPPLASSDPHATPPPTDDIHLGDTDLVDLILCGEGGLEALALRMIAAQSGIADVKLLPPNRAAPAGHVAAAVRQGDHDFGTLHAPPGKTAHASAAPPRGVGREVADNPRKLPQVSPSDRLGVATQTLQVWADWLVRWLRLEAQFSRLRDLSMKDELTGVWNRRYFNRFLQKILNRAAEDRQQVTLLVFDIDDFKQYNDAYGHAAGDEILREIAKLMTGSVREHDVVARIGGDEFAVIFWDAGQQRRPHSKHPDDVLNAAKRFQRAVVDHRFPKLLDQAAGMLTISGGLAGFPWDGRSPEELLEFADTMAMRSKKQGKNAITFGPGARVGPSNEAEPDADG